MLETLLLAQSAGFGNRIAIAWSVVALALLLLIVIGLLSLLVVLIKHRRWGVLALGASLVIAPLLLMVVALTYTRVSYAPESGIYQTGKVTIAQSDRAPLPPKPVAPPVAVFRLGEEPTPNAGEVQPVNASIDVGEPVADEANDEPSKGTEAETLVGSEEPSDATQTTRPAWVNATPEANQKVVQVDPRAQLSESRREATLELARWGWQSVGGDPNAAMSHAQAEQIAERLHVDDGEHIETRDVAGGEVYRVWWLGQIDDGDRDWLAGSVAQWERANRRTTGVRTLAAGGVGAVTLVALLHGLLRVGSSTPDEPAA